MKNDVAMLIDFDGCGLVVERYPDLAAADAEIARRREAWAKKLPEARGGLMLGRYGSAMAGLPGLGSRIWLSADPSSDPAAQGKTAALAKADPGGIRLTYHDDAESAYAEMHAEYDALDRNEPGSVWDDTSFIVKDQAQLIDGKKGATAWLVVKLWP